MTQITSYQTSLPLKLQLHQATGFFVCMIAMLGIYYGNGWGSRSLPFMSTRLLTASGKTYPSAKVFVGGVLDESALAKYGIPQLTGSFAYAMFMANAAVRIPLRVLRYLADANYCRLGRWWPTVPCSGAATLSGLTRAPGQAATTIVTIDTWLSTTKRHRGGGTSLF